MTRLLLALCLAAPAVGQTWGATASHATQRLDAREPWAETRLAAGLDGDRLGGAVEVGVAERFGQAAPFVGADVYPVLADGVYGNVRARLAPGSDVTARLDLGAQVFAAVGGGWEASGGVRRMAYEGEAVHIGTAGLGLYVDAWYLRATVSAVPSGGRVPVSGRVSARYLTGGSGGFGRFWEVSGGRGEEAEVADAGAVSIRDAWHATARAQQRVAGPVLATVGVGYVDDGALSRVQAQAGITVTW